MVSTFKYWSFKELSWARQHPGQMLLVIVLGAMIVATNPELFLFIIFTGYAVSGPVRRLILGSRSAPQPEPVKDTL
jgi:CDP-diacylglycerol--serine O-phosphatidyltransferase